MTDKPKISIITIAYNAESVIEPTLQSVIAQTYPNIEYIVVDGASKDGTMNIVQKYANKITTILSERDKSHFDAMNKGLRLALGEFVWFMHAGDQIYEPETLCKAMEGYAGEDFIYGATLMVTPEGQARDWYKPKPKAEKVNKNTFRNGMVVCHQSMIVRREICPEYRLDYPVSADHDWILRVMEKVKSARDAGVYMCRYLEGGISGKNRVKSWKERYRILKDHFGFWSTVSEHIKIVAQALLRGRVS